MARPVREPKVRLNLDIPVATRERLERLQAMTGAETMTEVVRRTLVAYEDILKADGEVIIREEDGRERKLKFIT